MAQKTAVLLGATGMVGQLCMQYLAADDSYSRIIAPVRRPMASTTAKIDQRVIHQSIIDQRIMDPADLTSADFAGVNDVFCALGTTMAKAGSPAAFRAVDYELPIKAAHAAKDAGVERFLLVSSAGADPASRNFYLRTKGELERDLASVGLKTIHIFRPGLLLGRRQELRVSEAMAQRIGPFLNLVMWGPLRRYRSIRAEAVARAMVAAARDDAAGLFIHEYDEIIRLSRSQKIA